MQERLRLLWLPFWNPDERRLRTLWRILGWAVIASALTYVTLPLTSGSRPSAQVAPASAAARAMMGAVLALASVALAAWLLERRPLAGFGLQLDAAWWADFGFGLGLGGLLMSAAFAGEWAAGWISVTGTLGLEHPGPAAFQFLPPLGLFLAVGFYEELISRGFLLRVAAQGLTSRRSGPRLALCAAVVLTSALFGLGHANNPNATPVSTLNICLAGVFLALPYVLTGRLALSIGLHVTWNLFQGPVYGFPVSGISVPGDSLFTIEQGGPAAWTGGTFGPEGGIVGLLLMALGSALILAWVRRREGRLAWCVELTAPPVRRAK